MMPNPSDHDSRSPPPLGGVVTRAQPGPQNDTAQPSLTSGFGAVIAKEHDLQIATDGSLDGGSGQRSNRINRLLRQQHSRLGANIALLEQRYEALPNPEPFESWENRSGPAATPRRPARDETELLPDLIAQHTRLLADIESLIGSGPDGQRGELILTEVSRNHREMAGMLTALLQGTAAAMRAATGDGVPAPSGTTEAQENWDNEGGLPNTGPAESKRLGVNSPRSST